MDLSAFDLSFDVDAFDEAIREHGIKLVHWRAQRCPVGMVNLDDNRRPHEHHEGCFNGFLYTKVGTITGLFTSNNKKKSMEDVGFVDFSTVQATFARTYDDCDKKLVMAPFDRFYPDLEETQTVQWQLFQHNASGIDRLKFPVECIDGDIIDARFEHYKLGTDFEIVGGAIKWTGSHRPAPEIDVGPGMGNGFGTDRGAVCSVRYTYRSYWYVGAIPHEIRVAQVPDGFERHAVRAPQMAILHREYVGQNIEQEAEQLPSNSDNLRRVMAPMYGSFGPK